MYKQVTTTTRIRLYNSESTQNPIATLVNDCGQFCQIANDDHCYVIYLEQYDGTYVKTTHIFREVFEVLKNLPSPS